MRNHIIFFSGGLSSFSVADYVKEQFPEDNICLYFNDILWESEDLYRGINEASDKLELPLLTHSIGLDPIQLMFEQKVVFNSRNRQLFEIPKNEGGCRLSEKGYKTEN